MPKGVLFDLDGTLLDSAPDFIVSLNNLLKKYGKPKLDSEIIRANVSDGSWKLISLGFQIERSHKDCKKLREELLNEYEKNLLAYGGVFDGVSDILESLKLSNIPYGIITNKPLRFAKSIIKKEIVFEDCKVLICSDHLTNMKPDPEGILKGCKELGIHPTECVYVGDHINDLEAGINAGTKILACYYGYSLNQGSHARHIMGANQPRDLIKLIASL